MKRLFRAALIALAAALVAVTLLPLSSSTAWWVRAWEFPRIHILALAVLTGLAALAVSHRSLRLFVIPLMVAVAGWQASWVWPYMPWTAEDVAIEEGTGVTALALNVLQNNGRHGAVRDLITDTDPDILILMETDEAWADALSPVLDGYPDRVERIADDHYGMIFATRLPAERLELVRPDGDQTSMGMARLRAPGGAFDLTALHPRPPVPGTSRQERDDQISRAAALARAGEAGAVVLGDFNDVAWSRDSQRFRDLGDFRDPRAGRGVMASFDARSWWLRFPLDQALVTDAVRVHDFRLGPDVGSDHLPVILRFSVRGETPGG